MRTVIIGTGSFIPANVKTNRDFTTHDFYDDNQAPVPGGPENIVKKFEMVTGISERRYADADMNASDMAIAAAGKAIADAQIDPETLDQIILAQNFGDVKKHTIQSDAVPSLACRVKQALGIRNPACIPYDLLFGCPGWIQGLIHADAFFRAGLAKRCLVLGAETLSRVIDDYDRDSMIFSDGAGAAILEKQEDATGGPGILGSVAQSFTLEEADYIYMGKSCFPHSDPRVRYLKMQGRKVYEFALKRVPEAMKVCIEASHVPISGLKKIFIHQANEKMDAAIIKAFYALFPGSKAPADVMPMNIRELGNSSVATVPTLFDMVLKGALPGHTLNKGDVVLFASVGAGMNINAVCYRL
ncbi:MAG: ketoacyl-ACP synthase III [Bacteroidota bacterium]|nr:ketoacyl-ACP synthase III [Bacteroidota bacterium]MDP4217138.1 ketoacyl-ACP synthase III [Bacteroidota bacterium]MDP4245458.1 ketoacyl-ACP synthase III [Bacteroidota bacterium]MDP4254536.1 ketoacyl-ACP synthase III [Bacteroidota bacterium]MDP4258307.1 ketoacyl-ACP synthase III [Bacteroidota bacterium]